MKEYILDTNATDQSVVAMYSDKIEIARIAPKKKERISLR